jgi:hypothetical protein
MIKPCNQPLKINPFTSYRDPVTGKWVVVETVQYPDRTDSDLKIKIESENESKVETTPAPTLSVSLPKKCLSFSLSLIKYPVTKSVVNIHS